MEDRPDAAPPDAADRNRAKILSGSLGVGVLRFGAPLALAMALQVMFNLVDQYLIARLPPEVANASLDALGICDMVAAVGTIVSYGVSTATVALVSQHHGKKDLESTARVAWGSVGLVVLLGLAFGALAILGADAIVHGLLGAKGPVRVLARDYLQVIMGGNITIFILFQLTAIQRAMGHSRTPLVITALANVLNLGLAVVMVYGPGPSPAVFAWGAPIAAALGIPRMEVVGAAWATIIARAVACLVLGIMVARELRVREHAAGLFPTRDIARKIWDLAWPASAQFIVRTGAVLVVIALVHHYYTTTVNSDTGTAYALCLRLETMALFVSMGWGSAAQTFVGMNLGAGHRVRAARAGWIAGGYNMATMALLAVLYLTVGREILGVFTQDARILDIAVHYLRVVGPSYVMFGLAIVLGTAMTGAGATRLTLTVDAILVALVQVPLMFVVVAALRTQPDGLWRTIVAVNVVSAAVYFAVFRDSGRWQQLAPTPAGG